MEGNPVTQNTPVQPHNTEITQVNAKKNDNFIVTLLSLLLLIAVSIAGFFAYQTQKLVKQIGELQQDTVKSTPIPSATPNPTLGWKEYTNSEFTFKYPSDWILDSNGRKIQSVDPEITLLVFSPDQPMYNECMRLDNTQAFGDITVKTYSRVVTGEACSSPAEKTLEKWIVKTNSKGFAPGIQYIYLEEQKEEAEKIFDSLLSTVTLTTKACTTEAKICPDGSAVGRTGPNCEFAPCPTTSPTR